MSCRVDKIQWNPKESRKRPKIHAHVIVYDHRFMVDGLYINVHIALQKMFRLGIVGAAQHLLDKDLSSACRSIEPKKDA